MVGFFGSTESGSQFLRRQQKRVRQMLMIADEGGAGVGSPSLIELSLDKEPFTC